MKLRMTLFDKHELYAHHMEHPTSTYSQLAAWAAEKFTLASTPTKATIGNVLKRNVTLSIRADNKVRSIDRPVALPAVEESVLAWVLKCEELGVCITGELIRKQASATCDQMNVPVSQRPAFSKGWLYKFQVKHGLTSKLQHGEAASVSPALVAEGRQQMKAATSGYSAANTYNMDETAFFFCLSPHRSITRHRQPGTKKSKKRITVALTTNADGTDVVDPLFIGTAARPRCFNGVAASDLGFNYMYSKKGWMTGGLFNTYLLQMNQRMLAEDRKVLLLVDNAPPHRPDDESLLTNIKVKMLPKNTTAHLQPQDAGIIASFKAKVKQRQLQNALQQIDSVMAGRQDGLYEVPLVEAMSWAKDAWRSVSQATVVNCWNRTGILDTELSTFSEHVASIEL
ncbi:hypothetical protein AaE_015279 [Aphanomyces astaci]|uniref:HTH CENPB-type domain-containing protein n=1 Tax=Aphanomyces astaci TaxID=112090 RepID=A0A6A4Z2Z9_APHAT|nr:hypothetical protein AaE_015279 [Aphanomyces astaci]